ncbi:hypothetical protein [Nocardia otitidiscaviarum]|uniref:hypothetical protein n=1 Tax=Nocardia otitidiscaviarum TaxID=1823 RepID=UPI0018960EEE|nr:hypothetical protein [Nocardia otitidiscaviarum]MBF6180563.1 hypothetical protein [Nocardia otitidiscaviarum]
MTIPIAVVSLPGTMDPALDAAVEFGRGRWPPGVPQVSSPGTAAAIHVRLPGIAGSSRGAAARAAGPVAAPLSCSDFVWWHPVMGAPPSGS